MNSMQFKDKLRNASRNSGVDFNTLLRLYMYDRFIERMAVSKYKDNFILKGGFYLSILFGVENRHTMDIDAMLRNINFNEDSIVTMIKEIIDIRLDDNITLIYIGISKIRDEDEYGGFRIELFAVMENIREKFHLDIVTGDSITPSEVLYEYTPVLTNRKINIWAYNIETVLAEKLETTFTRMESNGRLRDFYDIYLIYKKDWDNISKINFKKAIRNTFTKRKYSGNIQIAFDKIKNSDILSQRWSVYSKKI